MKAQAGEISMRATQEVIDLASALSEARAAIRAWQEREDDLKTRLFHVLDEQKADSAFRGKDVIVRRKVVVTQRFSSKEFKNDHPDLYDRYVAETSYTKVEV